MKALQANAVPAIQQNRLLRRDNRGCTPGDRTPTRTRAGQHGLQVSVAEPPGWREIVAVYDHGGGIPERSAHSYFDAIICDGCAVPFASGEIARWRRVLDGKDRRIPHPRLHL